MVARISCFALAMGILVGCYDIPQPECGFACGPAGECPSSYACFAAVNRCVLEGTSPFCAPAPVRDAGMDTQSDTAEDLTPPGVILASMTPTPGSVDIPLTGVLMSATFNEDVLGVNNQSFTVEHHNGIQVSGNVEYQSSIRTATFQPFSALLASTAYTVIAHTSITDLAGNTLETNTGWTFTTVADTTRPTVSQRSPAIDAMGVGVGAPIFADFSEAVTGVSNTSFTLTEGGTPVAGTVSYSGVRAFFMPTTQLDANLLYRVSLTSAIQDMAAPPNALVPTSWTFMTGDDIQIPAVVTRTPLPASAGVPVTTTVTASFNEDVINLSSASFTLTPMGGSPIATTITYASATRLATLTPDLPLDPSTQYTAQLTAAITDSSANALSPLAWSFTTAP